MDTQLDQARSAVARQRHELDELRTRLEAKEERLDALLAELAEKGATSPDGVEGQLRDMEQRRDSLAEELRRRFAEADLTQAEQASRFASLEDRLDHLEEGGEIARVRMRLERVGHQLGAVEGRVEQVAGEQRELREALAERGSMTSPRALDAEPVTRRDRAGGRAARAAGRRDRRSCDTGSRRRVKRPRGPMLGSCVDGRSGWR